MIELLNGLYEESSSGGSSKNKKKFNASIDTFIGELSGDGSLGRPSENPDLSFTGVKHLSAQILAHRFYNTFVKSISFPDLEDINGAGAVEYGFYNSQATSVSAPKLTSIGGSTACSYAFAGCDLQDVEFPLLKEVTGAYSCQNMFDNNKHLKSVSFTSLDTFGSFTNQFQNMLHGCSGVTVHFKSSIQSVIGSWTDVINGFGGTNTTVLWDL